MLASWLRDFLKNFSNVTVFTFIPTVAVFLCEASTHTAVVPQPPTKPPSCRSIGTSSMLDRRYLQVTRIILVRRSASLLVYEVGFHHFLLGLENPLSLQGPHLRQAVSQPTLMWGGLVSLINLLKILCFQSKRMNIPSVMCNQAI
ncbi:hypothetical protein Bca101_019365 [Brassica carinata]